MDLCSLLYDMRTRPTHDSRLEIGLDMYAVLCKVELKLSIMLWALNISGHYINEDSLALVQFWLKHPSISPHVYFMSCFRY